MEERRLRTESQPIGRLVEQMLMTAYSSHPYKQPVVGYMSDLQTFSREDAAEFHAKYYVPSNIVIAIVGDVKAKDVTPILDRYFNRLPAGPTPEPIRTIEPPQIAEKTVAMPDDSQPFYLESYHKPADTDPDQAIYDAISDLLSTDRTARLYRSLVRDKKLAAQTGAFPGFPGAKYPNLMLFYAVPAPGHDNDEVKAALRAEIEKLKTTPITDAELAMVKTRAKANLIRGLEDNMGIATQLALYEIQYGDWRELFRRVGRIEKVTTGDIQRIAQKTFVPTNRTVAYIENKKAAEASN
jgi:predicted Zn-dependent peptidase